VFQKVILTLYNRELDGIAMMQVLVDDHSSLAVALPTISRYSITTSCAFVALISCSAWSMIEVEGNVHESIKKIHDPESRMIVSVNPKGVGFRE